MGVLVVSKLGSTPPVGYSCHLRGLRSCPGSFYMDDPFSLSGADRRVELGGRVMTAQHAAAGGVLGNIVESGCECPGCGHFGFWLLAFGFWLLALRSRQLPIARCSPLVALSFVITSAIRWREGSAPAASHQPARFQTGILSSQYTRGCPVQPSVGWAGIFSHSH